MRRTVAIVSAAPILITALTAHAGVPVDGVAAEALGITAEAFIPPELGRKAAVLEACIENPEPSLAVTAVLYPDVVEARDSFFEPLFFYEVVVVAGENASLDFDRLAGLFDVEENQVETGAGALTPDVAGAAGTWALTKEGRKAIDVRLSRAGVDVIAVVLVPATTDYPMLVLPSGGFGVHRPAAAAAARRLAPDIELGSPRAVVAGRGQYLLFENEGRFVALEIFDYRRFAAEDKPYFADAASFEDYVKAGPAESPADESDKRWSEAMRSLWPWLEEVIPDGNAVTVDAAAIERKYNEFMQARMGAGK